MSLSQVYSAVIGHVITAARWNNEFGNIYANGTDLAFPLTKAVSLAGFTLTLDSAGVSTFSSSSLQALAFAPGAKAGAPGVNGNFLNVAAATFTDTLTSSSGTAAVWNGSTFRAPTLAATNTLVTTTDASTLHLEAGPTAGSNQTLTNAWALSTGGDVKVGGDLVIRKTDSTRTATVDTPLIVESTTTGTPDVGIGTGILLRAESADETLSDIGQVEFSFTDKTAASEDSKFSIKTRVAGAALTETFSFQSTAAFKAKLEHANSADRTYTLPDFSCALGGSLVRGPSSTGTGSTRAHEGSLVISADQALDGVHFFTNFTLDAAKTITLAAASHRLVIVATGTITINGTIQASGKGANASAGAGFSQPGGAGGRGGGGGATVDGGAAYFHFIKRGAGGVAINGASPGGAGSSLTSTSAMIGDPFSLFGGAAGSVGGDPGTGGVPGAFGPGGGSIVLIAPIIILGAASVINTSGTAGGAGTSSGGGTGGGGGGGGAGNFYAFCVSFTDGGCTFTMNGGAAGPAGFDNAQAGGAGADGIKQINIYA